MPGDFKDKAGRQSEEISEAIGLLEDFEKASDPQQKIRRLEAGIDLLNKYVKTNPAPDEPTKQWIKDVRASYMRKLVASLADIRGGPSGLWLEYVRVLLLKMRAEADDVLGVYSRNAVLFPRPLDGSVVQISPPGLAWLPIEGASNYRVEIRNNSGALIYKRQVGKDPVHLPDHVLPPGIYTWDVIALDAQGNDRASRGTLSFTIAEKMLELPWAEPEILLHRVPKEHPRVLYLKRDLPAIRATLQTTRKQGWTACLKAADRALETPAPIYPNYHLSQDRMSSQLEYRQYVADFWSRINVALMDLCLAFLISEKTQYARAAKRILLEVANWPTGDNDVTSVSARWGDEPGLSLACCAHRAYDWLYDALSDEERAKVLAMCEARAWQAHRRLFRCNYLAYPGESHNGRLITYLAEMAIAMAGESEGAPVWLDYALKALTTFFPHWGGDDGGWAEGTAYALWYNPLYIPALDTLRTATGFDLWQRPFFRNVRYFFFYCAALRGEISPFGDGAETVGPGINGGSGYASLLWYHAHRFDDPITGWWVQQLDDWNGSRGEFSLLFEDSVRASARPPICPSLGSSPTSAGRPCTAI